MYTRRPLLGALGAAAVASVASSVVSPARAAYTPVNTASFPGYLEGLRARAMRAGISRATVAHALAGLHVNQRAIELDRNQPESTLTWSQYRARIVSPQRIALGRQLYAKHRALLGQVTARYGVPAGVIMGIWALESNYGASSGDFNIIQCLATLAWEGRRRAFFESELLDALRVIERGDVTAERMVGSYAGAMGQTQFMPDSVLKYAVDWDGNGKRDLWHSMGDIFASTANYLAREGWSRDIPWGRQIQLPPGFDPRLAGHGHRRPIRDWHGVGLPMPSLPESTVVALVLPGGAGDEAFLAYYPSYKAIRAYNPPDKYCLSVGLLGDAITL
jgi:membrane-bound lytic murein transglycosylase B